MFRNKLKGIALGLSIGLFSSIVPSTFAAVSAYAIEQDALKDGEVRYTASDFTVAKDKDLVKDTSSIIKYGRYFTKDDVIYGFKKCFKSNVNVTFHYKDEFTSEKVYPDVTVKNAWIYPIDYKNDGSIDEWSFQSPISAFGDYECNTLPLQNSSTNGVGVKGNIDIYVNCSKMREYGIGMVECNDKASVGTWYKESNGWHFCYASGYRVSDTRFVKDKGQFYYFINGVMQTGWVKIYHSIDGKTYWHYFNPDGRQVASKTVQA